MKPQKILKILKSPNAVFVGALALGVLIHSTGYCGEGVNESIDGISEKIQNFLFGNTVRKVALTLGMGAGLFQAFMSGSIRPLLIYGGLGLAVCYLPKIVDWISAIG